MFLYRQLSHISLQLSQQSLEAGDSLHISPASPAGSVPPSRAQVRQSRFGKEAHAERDSPRRPLILLSREGILREMNKFSHPYFILGKRYPSNTFPVQLEFRRTCLGLKGTSLTQATTPHCDDAISLDGIIMSFSTG